MRISFNIYCGNFVKLLKVGLTIPWLLPYYWVSLELLTLRLVQQFAGYSSTFSAKHWFLCWFLLENLYSSKSQISVSYGLSLLSWGQWFAMCPPHSYGFKN